MTAQADFFPSVSSSPLIGVTVLLERAVDRNKPCCRSVATITPGAGPHPAGLVCADCGRFRGWMSKPTAQRLNEVIRVFGVPPEPLIIRDASHHFRGEH
jgi:hypothetical protein